MKNKHNFCKQLEELLDTPSELLTEEEKELMQYLKAQKESMDRFDGKHSWHFDREGNEITFWEWSGYASDPEYKIIAQHRFGPFFVSTVWLGIDHGASRWFQDEGEKAAPVIFETMIFDDTDDENAPEHELKDYQKRYSTEQEAKEGHADACVMASHAAYEIFKQKNNIDD